MKISRYIASGPKSNN